MDLHCVVLAVVLVLGAPLVQNGAWRLWALLRLAASAVVGLVTRALVGAAFVALGAVYVALVDRDAQRPDPRRPWPGEPGERW